MYFRAIKLRTDNYAETKPINFPFEISSLEVNESSDMFIQSGIPIDSKFMKYEEPLGIFRIVDSTVIK